MLCPRRLAPPIFALCLALVPEFAETPALGQEMSQARREAIQRTIERRRQRRLARAERPVGTIVAYPMPPALIIRQTPEAHDQIADLLRLLRGSPF